MVLWKEAKEEENIRTAVGLAAEGLNTPGAHHKQWYLEQILLSLGIHPAIFPHNEEAIKP